MKVLLSSVRPVWHSLITASLLGVITIGFAADGNFGNLTVTGTTDLDGNTLTFGTQGGSPGLSLTYADNGTDTLTFFLNRTTASFLWSHSAAIAAMRLTSTHDLVLYQSNGTTAGITLTPATNTLALGATTLYRDATTGALRTNGALTVDGAATIGGTFTAPTFATSSGSLTGGTSGLSLNAGGTGQNISLNPSGGKAVVNGPFSVSGHSSFGSSAQIDGGLSDLKSIAVFTETVTATSGISSYRGVDVSLALDFPSATTGITSTGINSAVETKIANVNDYGTVRGSYTSVRHSGAGRVTTLTGSEVSASIGASGSVTTLDGIRINSTNVEGGSADLLRGAYIFTNNAGPASTSEGIRIQTQGRINAGGTMLGLAAQAVSLSPFRPSQITGIFSTARSTNPAGADSVIGAHIQAGPTSGTGTINDLSNIRLTTNNGNATATISKGIDYSTFTNTGTITNTYGVYIGILTAGTQTNRPFSFYAADTNAYNYFGGNVGIATLAPSERLEVTGNAKIGGTAKVTGAVLTFAQGDLSMGTFTSGPTPNTP
jgi:hypothetical protein